MVAIANKVTIDYELCKRCGICAELCPKGVFASREDGTPEIARGDACTRCGFCILICPDYALDWSPERGDEGAK